MSTETENKVLPSTDDLIKFLGQNTDVDFLFFDLLDEDILSSLNFQNLESEREKLVVQIKAYQRLIRIIPEKDQETAVTLMQAGIHSALQIAAMTRKDFMGKAVPLFKGDDKFADAIYQNALEKRSVILIQYMDMLQKGEPHILSARFN